MLLNNKEKQHWWENDHELCIRFSGAYQLLTVLGGLIGGGIAAFLIQQRANCGPSDQCFAHNFSTLELVFALGMAGIAYTAFSWWLCRHLKTRIDLATGKVHGWIRTFPREAFRAIVIADAIGGKMVTLSSVSPFGPSVILGYRFREHEMTTLSKLLSEALKLPVVNETEAWARTQWKQPRWQQRVHTGYLLLVGSAFVAVTLAFQIIFAQDWHQSLNFAPIAILFIVTGVMMIRFALTPPELRAKRMLGYRIHLAFGCLFLIMIPVITYKELSQSIHQFFNGKDWLAYLIKAREDPPYMLGANIAFALAFLRSGWKLRKEALKE